MTRSLTLLPAATALVVSLALAAPVLAASPAAPAAPATPALAPTLGPAVGTATSLPIAVLDMPRVLHTSDAGRSADKQLGELRAKYQAEIAHTEASLRAENEELNRQRSILSPAAFEKKRGAFDARVQASQRLMQTRSAEFDAATHQAQNQILNVVLKIVTDIMRDRHIELVIDRSQMVASVSNIEITSEVLADLNKDLPSIKVSVPEEHAVKAGRTKKK